MNDEKGDTPDVHGSFEAWARVSAALLQHDVDERIAVIEDHGLTTGAWDRADGQWLEELAKDVAAGKFARATEYGQLCAAELRRRQAAPRAETSAAPEPRESAQAPEPAPELVRPAAPPTQIPSYLLDLPAVIAERAPMSSGIVDVPSIASAAVAPLSVDSTLDAIPVLRDDPLPFGSQPSAGFVAALRDGVPPASRPASPSGDETLALPALQPEGDATLPFVPLEPGTTLTLEQYASLVAELSVRPENRADVIARYGLTDDSQWRKLQRHWQHRLKQSPDENARWSALYQQYRGWLVRQTSRR